MRNQLSIKDEKIQQYPLTVGFAKRLLILRVLLYFFCTLNKELKISVEFIRQIMQSETDSTIFLSYLKILEATKNKGGNLPHIKAISFVLNRSIGTTRTHLKKLLDKGWIRINPEKESTYTIVSADKLFNTTKVSVVALKIKQEVFNYSLVRFRAFLSEAIYQQNDNRKRAKDKYKKMQDKYKTKKEKLEEQEYKRSIKLLRINTKTYTSFTGSKIKNNKFSFKIVKLVGDIGKKFYRVSYNIETGESSLDRFFNKKEEINLVRENVKLKIDELLGLGSCKPESVAESPCSYSYRAYMIKKSPSTVRKYQSEFQQYYVKSEKIIIDKNLMIEHGKYIGNIFGIQQMKFNKAFNQTPTKRKYKAVALTKVKVNLR